ncbi:hypothetical protein OY671_012829, partial [Metschnikowia pulcherrima]
ARSPRIIGRHCRRDPRSRLCIRPPNTPIAPPRRSWRWAAHKPPFSYCRNSHRAAARASSHRPIMNMRPSCRVSDGTLRRCGSSVRLRTRTSPSSSILTIPTGAIMPPWTCSRCCHASVTSSSTRALRMPFSNS